MLILKVAMVLYVGFGVVLYFAQNALIYYPTPEVDGSDTHAERIAVDGAQIKVWVVGSPSAEALIYFGGNAEDVHRNAADVRSTLPGHTVYLVNYRGYGGSSGEPGEQALFADALAVFDHVAARHERVAVMGRSLGSGVATYLASERTVERLILVTPYDSVLAIAQRAYPFFPVGLMLRDRFDSVAYAAQVTSPVLALTAANDDMIPAANSQRLVAAFRPGQVEQVVVERAGHHDISAWPRYWEAIATFLQR